MRLNKKGYSKRSRSGSRSRSRKQNKTKNISKRVRSRSRTMSRSKYRKQKTKTVKKIIKGGGWGMDWLMPIPNPNPEQFSEGKGVDLFNDVAWKQSTDETRKLFKEASNNAQKEHNKKMEVLKNKVVSLIENITTRTYNYLEHYAVKTNKNVTVFVPFNPDEVGPIYPKDFNLESPGKSHLNEKFWNTDKMILRIADAFRVQNII